MTTVALGHNGIFTHDLAPIAAQAFYVPVFAPGGFISFTITFTGNAVGGKIGMNQRNEFFADASVDPVPGESFFWSTTNWVNQTITSTTIMAAFNTAIRAENTERIGVGNNDSQLQIVSGLAASGAGTFSITAETAALISDGGPRRVAFRN